MKRRWFLTGLALPVVVAGCRVLGGAGTASQSNEPETADGGTVSADRNNRMLVMATAANYPPYEQVVGAAQEEGGTEDDSLEEDAGVADDATDQEAADRETADVEAANVKTAEEGEVVGFDIDLAQLIAVRLGRELRVVNLAFGALIAAVANNEVDMAMAALEPNRDRKQQVDFSHIYYRSRHALISVDGYLRSRNLAYQTIGILESSVQARYVAKLTSELPGLEIVPYPTTADVFAAIDEGEIDGAFVEANIAERYLRRYPEFAAQLMPTDTPTGSAIALPKNSPLRSPINQAILDIKASGEMDQLIAQWFG